MRWLWIVDFFKQKVWFVWKIKRLKVVGEDMIVEDVKGNVKEFTIKPKKQTWVGAREDIEINLKGGRK